MSILITGGAGFIASHIVDVIIKKDKENVVIIDNLSSGSISNIMNHSNNSRFMFIKDDLREIRDNWTTLLKHSAYVFHFAANPEVRLSSVDPRVSFENNVVVTFNVLEAMRRYDVPYIVFASSSTVYGEAKVIPTPEDYFPLEPISVYGATKLACENLIIAYSKLYGIRSLILRYANIIGARSNHGVIIDFINKLRKNPNELEVLGDGSQKKSYLYVSDTIEATLHLFEVFKKSGKGYDIYNVGNKDWITVKEIADIVIKEMGLEGKTKIRYKHMTNDGRGWPGDVKLMLLDISKAEDTGWSPKLSSRTAVVKVVREMLGKE